jgi:periplasmic divalent cation tolerance protein
MEAVVVYITVPNEQEGVKIAKALVEEKLAGCINIVKDIRSIYSWQGKIEDEPELLLIAKSRRQLFNKLKDRVKKLHSYTVPEIIAIPVIEGSEDYLNWLQEVTLSD